MPLMRSLNMVHRSIGPSLARVGTVFGIYLVYYGIVTAFFGLRSRSRAGSSAADPSAAASG